MAHTDLDLKPGMMVFQDPADGVCEHFCFGSNRMTYYNSESGTIIWNFRTKTWKGRKIIQLSYKGNCTQYVKYTNMRMDSRPF